MIIDTQQIRSEHYTANGKRQHRHNDPKLGKHLQYCANILRPKLGEEGIKDQVGKALEIMECCNPSHSNERTQGLVIGRVQSGKTSSFSLVSAIAADNDYSVVIQLLGDKLNLVDDNFKDVRKNLGLVDDAADLDWYEPIKVQGIMNEFSISEYATLINSKKSYWDHNASKKVLYFYLNKHKNQIEKITEIIKKLTKAANNDVPVLIIDDEVDSFSVNTSAIGKPPKPTYKALERLKKACNNCTYLGYTATSQAIFLAHDNSFLRPDFYAVLDPGIGYVGNHELFGEANQILNTNQINVGSNQRHQPKIIDPKDPNNPRFFDDTILRHDLDRAIIDFFISLTFCWERGIKKPMSMMCFPDTKNLPQDDMSIKIGQSIRRIQAYLTTQTKKNRLHKIFDDIYQEKVLHSPKGFKKPSLQESKDLIKELIDNKAKHAKSYEIKILNQSNPGKIKVNNAAAWFLIGGLKLSRGYVVPELLTSFIPYQPGKLTMDVTQQRGRFFGYKNKPGQEYKDLISVYCLQKTFRLFQQYTSIEDFFFEAARRGAASGIDFNYVDPNHELFNLVLYEGEFDLTSAAKNKTTKYRKVTSSWPTSLYSPFITNSGGQPELNKDFQSHIDNFISSNTSGLQNIGPNNKFGAAIGTAQEFKCNRLPLDIVYVNLLEGLESFIHEKDKTLKAMIKLIGSEFIGRQHKCDIIYFGNVNSRSLSDLCSDKNGWFHAYSGYNSGPFEAGRKNGYVGDDYVILGPNFDPRSKNFDKDNNEHFTVQIHKIKNITKEKNGKAILNDSYQIRLHAPWDKQMKFFLAV